MPKIKPKSYHPAWMVPGAEVDVVTTVDGRITSRRTERVARLTTRLVVLETGEKFQEAACGYWYPAYPQTNHHKHLKRTPTGTGDNR
jgi:hypothetical protein